MSIKHETTEDGRYTRVINEMAHIGMTTSKCKNKMCDSTNLYAKPIHYNAITREGYDESIAALAQAEAAHTEEHLTS